MSDYTAPNKSLGENWTAEEHNQMKAAVNSKADKDSLKNDLETPSATTFPSTALLTAILQQVMTFRGSVNGLSNLDGCITPGYFTNSSIGTGDWHASFPETAPETLCRMGLLVYSTQNFINQELTFYLNRARVFKRTFSDGVWSDWVEYMTVGSASEIFAPLVKDGTPTVTLEDAPPGFGISISANSRDLGGIITITNTSANPQPYIEFKITFQYSRPTLLSVGLTAGNDTAMDGKKQVVTISAGGFKGKVSANIPVGGTSIIHYGIFQNQ